MSEAVLERVRDELELDETLSGEQLLAAARESLHLPETETDLASQVREICEELGIDPLGEEGQDQHGQGKSLIAEGVPPCVRVAVDHSDGGTTAGIVAVTTARTAVTDQVHAPSTAPPSYEDALDLLEDPRQLHARVAASQDRLSTTSPVPWAQQLLAQLSLRNEFQGDRMHRAFIRLFNAVAVEERSVRERANLFDEQNQKLRLTNKELDERLRDLVTHGASSAERDELQQKVSDLQEKLIATYEERERAAEQKQQLAEATAMLETSERTVAELTEQLRQHREVK